MMVMMALMVMMMTNMAVISAIVNRNVARGPISSAPGTSPDNHMMMMMVMYMVMAMMMTSMVMLMMMVMTIIDDNNPDDVVWGIPELLRLCLLLHININTTMIIVTPSSCIHSTSEKVYGFCFSVQNILRKKSVREAPETIFFPKLGIWLVDRPTQLVCIWIFIC